MSTRSRIAIQTKNGEYRSVYHHYDGYPEGVGVTLQQHVPSYQSAVQLVRGGDISYIDWNTGFTKYYAKRSSWDDPRGGKDEPWSWVKPIRSKSFQDLLDVTNGSNGCYLYVYYYGTHNPVCYNMSENAKQTVIPNSRKEVA